MSQRNQRDDIRSTVATVALGAAVGYGCYKLFEKLFNSNEPHSTNSSNPSNLRVVQPRAIPFRSSLPRSFPKDSKIYVIDSIEECRYAMRELKSHCEEYNVLGFDCEWVIDKYGVRQNVALLQLASHRGLCVLVRLCEFGKIPSELQEILEDRNILKVGVTPYADAKLLYQDFYDGNVNNRTRSTFDLRYAANLAKCFDGRIGLGRMSEKYLGVTLDKSTSTRCSNWNALTLDAEQIDYAAKDALVSIELFKYFAEKIVSSGVFRNTSTCLKSVVDKCIPYLDTEYNENKATKKGEWVLLE